MARLRAAGCAQPLRYGENPHQSAAFYGSGDARPGVATAVQHQGKELSYNNLNDTDAAFELVAELGPVRSRPSPSSSTPTRAASPTAPTLEEAYLKALRCDPVSAFGGIVALKRPLDAATAEEIAKIFTEVVIAPDATDGGEGDLRGARRTCACSRRAACPIRARRAVVVRSLAGGLARAVARQRRASRAADLKVVTKRAPTERGAGRPAVRLQGGQARQVERHRLCQGRRHGRHRRRPDEPRRLARASPRCKAADAAAASGAKEPLTRGSVVASDAFFPFADGLLAAAEAGATAVIQPGGSMRDDEVIAAADDKGLAMVFTGMRHFRH